MNRIKKTLISLWVLLSILISLNTTLGAQDTEDTINQVDELTNSLDEKQLLKLKQLINNKIDAIRNKKTSLNANKEKIENPGDYKKIETAKESKLKLEIENRIFAYNLENSNMDFRITRTFFGDVLQAKLSYQLTKKIKISGGGVFIRPFGEPELRWGDYNRDFREGDHSKKKIDLVQPYIQFLYNISDFTFIFGNIETPHDFHKLVEYDVYEYLRPAENGIQILYDGDIFYQDLFINWREKNTPGNHERFNVGSISRLNWHDSSLALQFLYVHRGGHEFLQDSIVFENYSFALVLDHSIPVKGGFIDRVGLELVPLLTLDVPPESTSRSAIKGYGGLSSIYLTSGDWLFKSGYWSGTDDVFAEEGLPFSRAKKFVYSELGLNKYLGYNISLRILLTGGLFGENLEDTFFDQKLVVYWIHDFGLGF